MLIVPARFASMQLPTRIADGLRKARRNPRSGCRAGPAALHCVTPIVSTLLVAKWTGLARATRGDIESAACRPTTWPTDRLLAARSSCLVPLSCGLTDYVLDRFVSRLPCDCFLFFPCSVSRRTSAESAGSHPAPTLSSGLALLPLHPFISCTSHCAMFIGDLIVYTAGLFSPLVLQVICVYSFIDCAQSVACTVLLLISVSQVHVQRPPCRQVGRLGWLIASALSQRAASCCTALFEQGSH